MFMLTNKLQILKSNLKVWNHNSFGNMQDNVKLVASKLDSIQDKIVIEGHIYVLATQDKEAQTSLDDTAKTEELFWNEKACVQWFAEGDRNTKFFQRMTNIHNSSKSMHSLKFGSNVITNNKQISKHMVRHFKDLFNWVFVLQENSLVEKVTIYKHFLQNR